MAEEAKGGTIGGAVGGVVGTLGLIGALAGIGVIPVGEADIAATDGVEIRANDTKMELTITEPKDAVEEMRSQEVATKVPIISCKKITVKDDEGKNVEVDSLYVSGEKDTTVIRHPRLPLHCDAEATAGQTYQVVILLDDKPVGHVSYTVPDLPAGRVCKLVTTNDFTTDLPAKR